MSALLMFAFELLLSNDPKPAPEIPLGRSEIHAPKKIGEARVGAKGVVPGIHFERSQSDGAHLILFLESSESVILISKSQVNRNHDVRINWPLACKSL
jgi:hypothetical protein